MGSPEILVFYCPSCWAETSIRAGLCPRGGADMEAVQLAARRALTSLGVSMEATYERR